MKNGLRILTVEDETAVAELERKFREAGAHKVHTVVESV